MNASILICTYNRASDLQVALTSIAAMSVPPGLSWEVILVDNNSNDGTRRVVEDLVAGFPAPLVYLFEGRQGKSYALNTGLAAARGDIIVLTDDDVTVDPLWLAHLVDAFDRHDCTGVAGRIIPEWSTPKPSWYREDGPYRLFAAIVKFELGEEEHYTTVPAFGANLAFRRNAFERFGNFREDLLLTKHTFPSGVDSDYCRRVLKAGEKIAYIPGAVVHHPVAQDRIRKSYFLRYYFNLGKTALRLEPDRPVGVRYFGVPRHLLRELAQQTVRWLTTLHPQRRFFHKLHSWRLAGSIAEARKNR